VGQRDGEGEIPVSEGNRRIIVHMVGNAHIDPIWLWTLDEGREEVLASYRTAVSLLRALDGYVFTSGATVTYRRVAEEDPALFEEIRTAALGHTWTHTVRPHEVWTLALPLDGGAAVPLNLLEELLEEERPDDVQP
jgi:hypothetical protein